MSKPFSLCSGDALFKVWKVERSMSQMAQGKEHRAKRLIFYEIGNIQALFSLFFSCINLQEI